MVLISDVPRSAILSLLQRYKLDLHVVEDGAVITGSFWGDSEAGIVGSTVFVRADTPLHSFLHETCHVICMSDERRNSLDRDAGGDDLEESAVCYLQVVLADHVEGIGRDILMQDMDAWGYSFRLGNTRDWFQSDAEDAKEFLMNHGLLDAAGDATFRLRS
jgi:hypothetical protein